MWEKLFGFRAKRIFKARAVALELAIRHGHESPDSAADRARTYYIFLTIDL